MLEDNEGLLRSDQKRELIPPLGARTEKHVSVFI